MFSFIEAHAVVGMHFGDEGKGRVVKHLIRRGQMSGNLIDLVIKHNGGSQAGHTAVDDEGNRVVHSQLGSGSLFGVPTYLAPTFYFNPLLLKRELHDYPIFARKPIVYVDLDCQVTWQADMAVNQMKERARGSKRHGSCGHGIFETFNRVRRGVTSSLAVVAYTQAKFEHDRIIKWHLRENPTLEDDFVDEARAGFKEALEALGELVDSGNVVLTSGVPDFAQRVIFESGQGLALDMDNVAHFPHLTPSKTGSVNPARLCALQGAERFTAHYVTRPYVTRHGAGRLPRQWEPTLFHKHFPRFKDETNVTNPWQESLRFGPIILDETSNRVFGDYGAASSILNKDTTHSAMIHITCAQQGDHIIMNPNDGGSLSTHVRLKDGKTIRHEFIDQVFGPAGYEVHDDE